MNKSDSIKNLAAALCKAQGEMGGATKDANNPFFKSKYADLGAVVAAIKEPFADNGLSYSQFPVSDNDRVGVETILMHESGEWLSNVLLLPMVKPDPQKAGSAITYARRYALQAIAGIPSEDDDGNAATQGSAIPKGNKQASFSLADIKSFLALDQAARDIKWPTLSPVLQNAINASVKNGN